MKNIHISKKYAPIVRGEPVLPSATKTDSRTKQKKTKDAEAFWKANPRSSITGKCVKVPFSYQLLLDTIPDEIFPVIIHIVKGGVDTQRHTYNFIDRMDSMADVELDECSTVYITAYELPPVPEMSELEKRAKECYEKRDRESTLLEIMAGAFREGHNYAMEKVLKAAAEQEWDGKVDTTDLRKICASSKSEQKFDCAQ